VHPAHLPEVWTPHQMPFGVALSSQPLQGVYQKAVFKSL
jgi:hypothetical protein